MEKRFLLAFSLSLLVLLGYPWVLTKFYGPPASQVENSTQPIENKRTTEDTSSIPAPSEPIVDLVGKEGLQTEHLENPLFYESEKIALTIDRERGSIWKVFIKEYLDEEGKSLKIVDVGGSSNSIGSMWFHSPIERPILYSKVEQRSHGFLFSGLSEDGILVEKEIVRATSPYAIRVIARFKNQTSQTVPIYYSLVGVSGLQTGEKRFFEGVVFGEGERKKFNVFKAAKHPTTSETDPQWVAMKEKYFTLILKPEKALSGYGIQPSQDHQNIAIRVWSVPQNLGPGQMLEEAYLVYVGPKRSKTLKALGSWTEGVNDYGMFGSITKLILWSLEHINGIVHNYGFSIVLMTILVSILMLPLSGASYKSMKRMRLLQPEITKIRDAYKDKPQKMNKEMMALYKQHKINPLGGCLPMLVQMPIFIAFYQALVQSIELKGAHFLFIKDLSLPDRAIPLPFELGPLGSAINILPILMMLAMLFQQKIMSPPTAPGPEGDSQKLMTTLMPFIFGVIFYGLPSGLVLYWLTNNIVMIITQKTLFAK